MMDVQTEATPVKLTKKQVRKTVYEKLSAALSDYKELNQKKFENKLRKASKLIAPDIRKALNKKSVTIKKAKEKQVAVKIAKA
jgi:CO dehydrogenase/acetyl-CoA synthase gamma subunit (corrinoid Fe-S protein)